MAAILSAALISGLVGCDEGRPSPTAPTASNVENTVNPAPPPAGGMTVRGAVSHTAFRALAGPTIEVLDGPQAGVFATTGAGGALSLTGVFDEATRCRATADAISIGVAGNYVALWLETLVEQVAPNTFLAFGAQAAGW